MDDTDTLAIHALDVAFDALAVAAAELSLASALASSTRLCSDAGVLADAGEREAPAVSSVLLRHA